MCFLHSCNKYIVDEYPQECRCERFAGIYDMYDPIDDVNYEMIISCELLSRNYCYDSISILNFANRYNVKYNLPQPGYYIPELDTTDYHYLGSVIFPEAIDHWGNRAILTVGGGYYGIDTLVNRLENDSINIQFSSSNLPFYIEDGVPWEVYNNVNQSGTKR